MNPLADFRGLRAACYAELWVLWVEKNLGVKEDGQTATVQVVVILDLLNNSLMTTVITMAHIEAADVDALVPHLNDVLLGVRSRTDCGYNLGLAHISSVQDAVIDRVKHSLLCVVVREAPVHTGRLVADFRLGSGNVLP